MLWWIPPLKQVPWLLGFHLPWTWPKSAMGQVLIVETSICKPDIVHTLFGNPQTDLILNIVICKPHTETVAIPSPSIWSISNLRPNTNSVCKFRFRRLAASNTARFMSMQEKMLRSEASRPSNYSTLESGRRSLGCIRRKDMMNFWILSLLVILKIHQLQATSWLTMWASLELVIASRTPTERNRVSHFLNSSIRRGRPDYRRAFP